jgi:hypothetical protein
MPSKIIRVIKEDFFTFIKKTEKNDDFFIFYFKFIFSEKRIGGALFSDLVRICDN